MDIVDDYAAEYIQEHKNILLKTLFGMELIDISKFYGIPFASHLVGHHFF